MSHPQLGGRYQLTSLIAAGGMGEVWRATDELLNREVAVKLLRQHVASDPAFRERFRSEARITAGLADPHIAQVFDYGEENEGAYLVMELVHGESLSAVLIRNGALTPEATLDVIAQSARGLAAAHRAGVIHRDIKPGNLLVDERGTVKITDFGIARALEAAHLTQTGTVLGTAQYVSPEQASGTRLTPSTDIYSLGVVAYECLAGHPPFTAENQVAIAMKHLSDAPPPLPVEIPVQVRDLVMAMLAKDPAHRPATAAALADHAVALRDGQATGTMAFGLPTDPAGSPVRDDHMITRVGGPPAREPYHEPVKKGRRVFLATLAAVLIAGVALFALMRQEPPGPTTGTGDPSSYSSPTPTPSPSRSLRPTSAPPTAPTPSARPSASPSATVSVSAPAAPASPSPSPSPTPTPTTPTETPSETPTPPSGAPTPPDSTPTETTLSNEETP